MNRTETVSLYDRLGRFDGITRIVHDVMENHLANPAIRTRFEATKDLDHAKKMAVEFFCAGCGGPEPYTGRDLVLTHKGMNISEQEFVAVLDDAMDALDKCGVDAATRNEVLGVLWSMKKEVVRV